MMGQSILADSIEYIQKQYGKIKLIEINRIYNYTIIVLNRTEYQSMMDDLVYYGPQCYVWGKDLPHGVLAARLRVLNLVL